jgi:hypothetical protein
MIYKLLQIRLWYEWDNHELDGDERKLFSGPGQIIVEQMSCEDTNIRLPKGLGYKIQGMMEADGELRGEKRKWPREILNAIEGVALGEKGFEEFKDLKDVLQMDSRVKYWKNVHFRLVEKVLELRA